MRRHNFLSSEKEELLSRRRAVTSVTFVATLFSQLLMLALPLPG
jgi:hypothetical protein